MNDARQLDAKKTGLFPFTAYSFGDHDHDEDEAGGGG